MALATACLYSVTKLVLATFTFLLPLLLLPLRMSNIQEPKNVNNLPPSVTILGSINTRSLSYLCGGLTKTSNPCWIEQLP